MSTPLKIGIVTYNLAKDWSLETIFKNLQEAKYQGVELRTTHAHGVEVALTPAQRSEVRKRFVDSPIKLVQLGSAFDFHSKSPEELRLNIDGSKEYAQLAHDVGAQGIKVRPNGLPEGVPEEVTLEQIGNALREVGEFAAGLGVEVRLEVHGKDSCRLPRIKKMMDIANHPNVFVNWNSNMDDLLDGGFDAGFDLVKDKIRQVHITELYREEYPWRRLFQRLHEIGYTGYCCAEVPASEDPLRFLRYYRALFLAYQESA
jgi:sugar phosphate isomerase/epimerase